MSSECMDFLFYFILQDFQEKPNYTKEYIQIPAVQKCPRTTLYAFGFRCNVLSYLKNRGSFLIQIHCFLQIHWFNESVRVQPGH